MAHPPIHHLEFGPPRMRATNSPLSPTSASNLDPGCSSYIQPYTYVTHFSALQKKKDDNQGKRSREKRSIEIAALLASVSKVVWSCHQLSSTNLFLPPTLLRIHFAHFSGLLTDDSCLLAKDRNYYFKNSPARGGY